MKKFIFPIFIALFSGVAFGAGCSNIISTNLPPNQQVGENQRFITADTHSDTAPKYLKCGADDGTDNKFCSIGTITFDSNYNVYMCKDKKWVKTKVEDCTAKARELLNTTGLKYNYQQAKATNSEYVLFYNKQSPGQHLVTYCLSPIESFKQMENECKEQGDLESGICYKLTTISNNTATNSTKASDNIGLQNSEQTIPTTDSLQETGDYETHEEFDSAAWRRDTENAYKHERDNAQSWANKGITAGSTLLTGEGAMKAAQAIAEQKADKKAEEQMAEWISKMGCEYGNGQQVNLGKEETLPGGNELTQYYTEYKQLADKLKATKAALNLRPGIEAEVLYDRAETGLYQYANAERQSGGFTSLSRALMNPEGTDAEQWNAQKAEVAKDLTTGTLLTAGGLLVGASNILVNQNHKKEYQDLIKKTTNVIKKIERDYPEILFIPTEHEPVVEIVAETPEEETYTTTFDINTKNETFKSDTFESGYLTLSDKGKSALAELANKITTEFENDENTKITKVTITASGFADPDPITKGWWKQLTRQYLSELETNSLPADYNGQIDANEKLAKARAENVMNYLAKQFRSDIAVTQDTATGAIDNYCKTTDTKAKKAECRHVDLTLQIETKTTKITKN